MCALECGLKDRGPKWAFRGLEEGQEQVGEVTGRRNSV